MIDYAELTAMILAEQVIIRTAPPNVKFTNGIVLFPSRSEAKPRSQYFINASDEHIVAGMRYRLEEFMRDFQDHGRVISIKIRSDLLAQVLNND